MFPVTVGEALDRASLLFTRAGLEEPRKEAEILLGHITGLGRLGVLTGRHRRLGLPARFRLAAAVRRRARHEPLAYITGFREFYGLDFKVSRAVLIPRPETEHLVEAALEWAREAGFREGEGLDVLDLGTGSGCLAVALAVKLPRASIWAVDISPRALRLALDNARRHGVANRINWRRGDYWLALRGAESLRTFNLVLSNPPYISREEWPFLPEQVRRYEPRLALDGGTGGLEGFARIMAGLPGRLRSRGLVLFEIGAGQRGAVEQLCLNSGLFRTVRFTEDYQGWPRVCSGLV